MIRKALVGILLIVGVSAQADVTRHPLPNNSTFPISMAVEVSSDTTLIYHSGQLPNVANPDADKSSREYYGDTETQALSVFKKIEASLENLGVGFGDIIKMTVFLVGDPENDGRMDFGGFMKAYSLYFGTEDQPNKPARSAFQIAGLARPNVFIEIEFVIARPK